MKIKRFKTRQIKSVSFGWRLRRLRRRKGLDLEEIEQQTKVHSKYLEAIEEDDYSKLPAEVYAIGFVKRYLDCLNQSKTWQIKRLEEFQSQFRAWLQKNQGRLAISGQLKNPRPIITPKTILGFASLLVVALVVGYIWSQIRFLTAAPILTIVSPVGKTITEKDVVQIIGSVNQDATILINQESITTEKDGSFSQKVKLTEGINNIEIKAQNRFNKQTVKNIQILKSRGKGSTRI
jgi:cytoskeletal protein RodZ